jgi:uncharacterized protein DUF3833
MEMWIAFCLGALSVGIGVWMRSRHLGFRAQSADEYRGAGAEFDIRKHLNGEVRCEGVIFGPTGRVSSRFVADFRAEWSGDTGRMCEHFKYDNGETQDRVWKLTVEPCGRIRAEAEDLVGTGFGRQAGSGVCLKYRIRLPESSGGHVLDAVDWMYLMENGNIINRSQFRKYGIKVAELVATMRPVNGEAERKVAA